MKIVSLVFLATISSVLAFDWQDGGRNAKWSFDCDFFGSDITSIPNSPGEQCGDSCADNAQCTHFTYFSGTCFLKRFNSPAVATDLKGAVCGWINRGGPSPGPPSGSGNKLMFIYY